MTTDAVVLIDKPAGPTSAAMVDWVKWTLRAKSVGHCGTLDPAATGLLVVCIGAATKLAALLTDADKTYEAEIAFGSSTTTGDAEGEVVEETEVDDAALDRAREALAGMVGELSLPPPAFSAVKVDGRRAHEAARAGKDPGLAPRTMVVHSATILAAAPGGEAAGAREAREARSGALLRVRMRVSKGTYIRSLAVELGRRVGVPAHLASLRRTAAGVFDVGSALGPFTVSSMGVDRRGKPRTRVRLAGVEGSREGQASAISAAFLDPIDVVPLPRVEVSDAEVWRQLGHGQAVQASHRGLAGVEPRGSVAVVSTAPRRLILASFEGSGESAVLRPTRVVIAP